MGVCSFKTSDKELQKAQYLQRLKEFKAKFKQSTAEIIQNNIELRDYQEDDYSNVKYIISRNPIVKRRSKQQIQNGIPQLTAKNDEN